MAHIDGEILIQRAVDEVFDFVADERNEPRYNPRMLRAEQISIGPVGVGTRFHAEMSTMGRPAPMVIEFTGYERPRLLASSTHLSRMDIDGTLTFEPVGGGTRMRWSWEMRPHGSLRVLRPLLTRLGRRRERTNWAGLKEFLEHRRDDGGDGRRVPAYLRPPALTRHVVNPLAVRLQTGGVRALTVTGRRSGRAHTVPVIPVETGESRYLVAPFGESEWVRNLRAAGMCTLEHKGQVETVHATEVPVEDRAVVIAAYRDVCGRAVSACFTRLPDPGDHPVFRIVPSPPGEQ